MPDINLTICLRFDSTAERAIVQATDQKYRELKRPTVAESLLNILLLCRRLKAASPSSDVEGVVGHVELDDTIYEVHIKPCTQQHDKTV